MHVRPNTTAHRHHCPWTLIHTHTHTHTLPQKRIHSPSCTQVKCQLQAVAKTLIGDYLSHDNNTRIIGWKEVRWKSLKTLDSMREIFPCAKFVISFRNNLARQHQSIAKQWPWLKQYFTFSALTKRQHMLVEDFPKRHPNATYKMALENFTAPEYTRLLRWLGVETCKFSTFGC